MSNRLFAVLSLVALALVAVAPAGANHGPTTGHLAPSNANVDLISKLKLSNVEPELVTDVATYRDTAYVGAWGTRCNELNESTPGGFWSIDISNPAAPRELTYVSAPAWTYLTEGLHAFRMTTAGFTGDVLLVSNEICDAPTTAAGGTRPVNSGTGGASLYDVSNPAAPVPLSIGFGENSSSPPRKSESHTAFGWDAGDKAYAAVMDNEDDLDIDIFDITDPRNPVMIAETGMDEWAGLSAQRTFGNNPGLHDLVVRRVEGHWLMLASYWDAGFVVLNVDNPANPVFVKDSDYPASDPLTNFSPPEGNAHEAEWDRCPEEGVRSRFPCGDVRYILAGDEDFGPYRIVPTITSGSFNGQTFTGGVALQAPQIDDDTSMTGPTTYIGLACNPPSFPAAGAGFQIAIIQRGTCTFWEKMKNAQNLGYDGVIVFNSAITGTGCETELNMTTTGATPINIPGVFVSRSNGFRILGITGYNPANCLTGPNPSPPAIGTAGSSVRVEADFDGWGYLHLLNADTMEHIDAFAVPEAIDPRFAEGFGDLTIHEITTDPTGDVGYAAWYSAGFRVIDYSGGDLREVGHHIDVNGNNHWGIELNVRRDGRLFSLASDRDYGLYIYRFGTDLTTTASNARGTVGRTMTVRATVRNDGTISETNAKWSIRLPRGVRAVGAFASQGRCSVTGARTVNCNLGTIVEGGRAGISLRVRSTRAGTLRAEALVAGRKAEYDVGNNTDPSVLRVRAAAGAAGTGGGLTGRRP